MDQELAQDAGSTPARLHAHIQTCIPSEYFYGNIVYGSCTLNVGTVRLMADFTAQT